MYRALLDDIDSNCVIDGAPSSVDGLAKELIWVNTSEEEFIFQTRKHPETKCSIIFVIVSFENQSWKNLCRLLL